MADQPDPIGELLDAVNEEASHRHKCPLCPATSVSVGDMSHHINEHLKEKGK